MREIIFRGKKDNGDWAYGDLIHHKVWKSDVRIFTGATGISCDVDTETVGQYTGLTDKNGTRIFEGDILQNTITDENYILTYNEKEGCFVAAQNKGYIKRYLNLTRSEDFYVVIGNIHDNPVLLKEREEND